MSLVGGIISAKTNTHDLLARSSTCYCCRLQDADNTEGCIEMSITSGNPVQTTTNKTFSQYNMDHNSEKTAFHLVFRYVRLFTMFVPTTGALINATARFWKFAKVDPNKAPPLYKVGPYQEKWGYNTQK